MHNLLGVKKRRREEKEEVEEEEGEEIKKRREREGEREKVESLIWRKLMSKEHYF